MAALALSWLALAFVAAAAPEPSLHGRQPPARSAPPPSVQTTLVVTWEMDDPNGQPRKVIKTNGRFPGPTLVLNEDDEVEVTVRNHMPFNTTMHWHGLAMTGTPWSDGVPGLGQKPIEPNQSYVYRFKATPPGTYWYHSHSRATLLDGCYGPIFIRRKPGTPAPWSTITNDSSEVALISRAVANPQIITVSDWSNYTSADYMAAEEASDLDIFCRDSVLINGKGSIFCPSVAFLNNVTDPGLVEALGAPVNDKGCLPFVYNTEGPYLPGKPDLIPPGLQSGCSPTTGHMTVIEVDPADCWVSLNFVAAATIMLNTFSIDQHEMWLYEVDGHYVEPRKCHGVLMFPGERYAVLIKLDQQRADHVMRFPTSLSQTTCGYAIFRYRGGRPSGLRPGVIPPGTGFVTYGGLPTSPNVTIVDGAYDHVPPWPATPPAATANEEHVLSMGRWEAPWRWTFTGKGAMPPDESAYQPLLYYPTSSLAMNPNLTIQTKNGSWVDLVLRVGALPNEPAEISHAIHKHGSKIWLIGQGNGIWEYPSVAAGMAAEPANFNLVDPNYRDTIVTTFKGPAWFVIRYLADNPGPWLLHCHVETHLAGGMGMVLMDGIDAWPNIPPEYALGSNGF